MSLTDSNRFNAACVYSGECDEQGVERELAAFLQAFGMSRPIARLRAGSHLWDYRPLNPDILAKRVKRNLAQPTLAARAYHAACREAGLLFSLLGVAFEPHEESFWGSPWSHPDSARAVSDAAVADAALFWCTDLEFPEGLFSGPSAWCTPMADPNKGSRWAFLMWELSRTLCALTRNDWHTRKAWLRPLFEAFVCGCWLLYWGDDTLYWVAKPTIYREPGTQRVHHDTRSALESEIVNLYFWHGVEVPGYVILRPDQITIELIDRIGNAEVRRVMIERYRHGEEIHGAAAFIRDAGGRRLDHDERFGTLWRRDFVGDEPIVMIEVVNRTRDPDGGFKRYWLRVPPTVQTAREAVAWTFNMPAEQYAPEIET